MTAGPTHRHDQFHRGQVPLDQMADGTATAGYAPISNGDDTATWGPAGGSGPSACDHEHTTEEFVALGDTPEIFTLAHSPMWLRNVYVQGLRVPPSLVGGSGVSVEVDTVGDDVVVVDYEVACGSLGTPLDLPGETIDYGAGTGNLLATIVTTGPGIITFHFGALTSIDPTLWVTNDLPSSDIAFPVSQIPALPQGIDVSTPGTYRVEAPGADTWYVILGASGFDAGLAGTATYELTYATGTPTGTLDFPGSDGSGSFIGNIIGSDVVAGPSAVFVTIDSVLDTNYFLGVQSDVGGQLGYVQLSAGDFPTGTYVILLAPTDASFDIAAYDFFTGAYDGGLTNTGTYEIVALP